MEDDIRYEKHGRVRLVTINRTKHMNSLDFSANDKLVEVWKEFLNDKDARVAVITGSGDKAFCAGADLKSYTMNYATQTATEFREQYTESLGFGGITRGLKVNKPIIAAINGYAISGGLEIAEACDIRFCSPNAKFAHQDVNWGFHPCDGGCVRLPQIVGIGNALEMILSGEQIDAEHALRIGLVNRIYPLPDLVSSSLKYAEVLSSRAPLAQKYAKDVVLKSGDMSLQDALRLESRSFYDLGQTDDLDEGTTAFREKRIADFKGE